MVDSSFKKDISDRVLQIEIMVDSLDSDKKGDATGDDNSECSTVVEVKTVHINSHILAAKSPFFFKLFGNGMRESQQRQVTLRINAYEEEALMDLIDYMCSNMLQASTIPELLNVLMIADKFEVASCVRYSNVLLLKMPMSLESACYFVRILSTVSIGEVCEEVIQLKELATQYIVELFGDFKDFTKYEEEAMALPLIDLENILCIHQLKVKSEDSVFDFILKWLRTHYPNIEERQQILTKHLSRFLYFRYMSKLKLRQVLVCPEFDNKEVKELVSKVLCSMSRSYNEPQIILGEDVFRDRVYEYHPVKAVRSDNPCHSCSIYFDLKRADCKSLYESRRRLCSQPLFLCERRFHLSALCIEDEKTKLDHFSLLLEMAVGSTCTFNYEFQVMEETLDDFMYKVENCTLIKCQVLNLFEIPWITFMSKFSEYFIGGVPYIRVHLTVNKPQD